MYDLSRSDTVLLHQMGKVASTAITRGLERQGISVVHCHRLNSRYVNLALRRPDVLPALRAVEMVNRRRILDALTERKQAHMAKVITPFREPIGWLISRTFQAAYRTMGTARTATVDEMPEFAAWLRRVADAILRHRATSTDALMDQLELSLAEEGAASEQTGLIREVLAMRIATEWFEKETLPYLGVDVFSEPFPQDQSFHFYDNVMVIKYECMDQAAVEAMQVFAQIPELVIGRVNENVEDGNGGAYGELIRTLRFPRIFLEHIYGVPYMRHFYSNAERRAFIQRWDDSPDLAA